MRNLLIALLTFTFYSSTLFAAPVSDKLRPKTDVETRITSDKLTYQAEKRVVMFEGSVHVVRPDFDLRATRLTVYLKPAKGDSESPVGMATGDVDRLVAQGNVTMKEPQGRSGTSDKATYTIDDGVLILEGNPHLTDGENSISGAVIRYYTHESKSEVLGGGKKRVEAIFNSSKKGK